MISWLQEGGGPAEGAGRTWHSGIREGVRKDSAVAVSRRMRLGSLPAVRPRTSGEAGRSEELSEQYEVLCSRYEEAAVDAAKALVAWTTWKEQLWGVMCVFTQPYEDELSQRRTL